MACHPGQKLSQVAEGSGSGQKLGFQEGSKKVPEVSGQKPSQVSKRVRKFLGQTMIHQNFCMAAI